MEEEGQNRFDRDTKFSGGSWRNGGRHIVIYSTILILFNHLKSVGGMEEEGQKKFDRDSKFSGGSWRNGGRQSCYISYYFDLIQSSKICWRNGGNLKKALNCLEGAGGMEE